MLTEEKFKMDISKILSLLLLVGVYAFWFYVIATGSDILKGEFTFNIFSLSINFNKITSFFMFLTLVTMITPLYMLQMNFSEEERVKGSTINNNASDRVLSKIDKWMGIKLKKGYSIQELAEARFKAVYSILYVIVGFSLVGIGYFLFVEGANFTNMVGSLITTVIYGILIFVFHKYRKPKMLGILALFMIFERILTIVLITHRPSGVGIVILIALVAVSITAFRAHRGMKVNSLNK